jgi:RNA polymerase sigma-70 factor (ECF subfamily)
MADYCDGNHEAFRDLYAMAAPRLLAYLLRLARDRTTAEEILQATFMKLHQSRAAYIRGADPLPWLHSIAYHTYLDEVRRRKRSRVQLTRDGAVGDLPERAPGPDEPDEHEMEELMVAVRAAVEQLPRTQRDALVLTKIEGKHLADAAAILGATPGAVKLRVHRGCRAIRGAFQVGPSSLPVTHPGGVSEPGSRAPRANWKEAAR